MYAFKAERPDAARRYHSKFVSGTNYQNLQTEDLH